MMKPDNWRTPLVKILVVVSCLLMLALLLPVNRGEAAGGSIPAR